MNQQRWIKTAAGIGLVASSLVASATINGVSFGSPQIFDHIPVGGYPYYALFLPSGNTSTDAVVLVEAQTGATSNTWNYVVGAETLGATANKFKTDRGALVTAPGTDSVVANGYPLAQIDSGVDQGSWSGQFLLPAGLSSTEVITYPFAQTTALSGASSALNCLITFEASINSAEDMVYAVNEIRPQNWGSTPPSANATFQLTTGSVASQTLSGTYSDYFGAYNGAGGGNPKGVNSSFSLPGIANATAYASLVISAGGYINNAGAAVQTVVFGSQGLATANLCFNARRAREALNSSGIIGNPIGLAKIW